MDVYLKVLILMNAMERIMPQSFTYETGKRSVIQGCFRPTFIRKKRHCDLRKNFQP